MTTIETTTPEQLLLPEQAAQVSDAAGGVAVAAATGQKELFDNALKAAEDMSPSEQAGYIDWAKKIDSDLDAIDELHGEGMTKEDLHDEVANTRHGFNELLGTVADTTKPVTEVSEVASVPNGYKSKEILDEKARIDVKELKPTIKSLVNSGDFVDLEATELTTDTDKKVRLVDLRPEMTSSVRKSGPKGAAAEELDEVVLKDLKSFVENKGGFGSVSGKEGKKKMVYYTSLGNTKVRAYWMPVTDANSKEVVTIARIADCSDSRASEDDIYRAVLGKRKANFAGH